MPLGIVCLSLVTGRVYYTLCDFTRVADSKAKFLGLVTTWHASYEVSEVV